MCIKCIIEDYSCQPVLRPPEIKKYCSVPLKALKPEEAHQMHKWLFSSHDRFLRRVRRTKSWEKNQNIPECEFYTEMKEFLEQSQTR